MASGKPIMPCDAGITLGMGSANERRRYIVTSYLSWAHTQIYPCDTEAGLFRMKRDIRWLLYPLFRLESPAHRQTWHSLIKGLSPVTRNLCCQSARGNRSGAVRYFPEAVRPRGNTAAPDRFPRADWQHKFLVTGLNPDYNMVTVRV